MTRTRTRKRTRTKTRTMTRTRRTGRTRTRTLRCTAPRSSGESSGCRGRTPRPAPKATAAESAAHGHSPEAHFPQARAARAFPPCGFSCSLCGRLGAKPHGGKMGRMGNRHLGHYFCILACFTRSKRLLSSEQQKSKLSPAGSGSKTRTLDHLVLPVPVLVNRFQSTENHITVYLL